MGAIDDDARVSRVSEHLYSAQVNDRWNVGPVANGGYLITIASLAMREEVEGRELRTLTVHFLRPAKNAEVRVEVEPVKIGRRFATLQAKMIQGDGENARILATFGSSEGARLVHAPPPQFPALEACERNVPIPSITVAQRFDMRYTPETAGFLAGKRTRDAKLDAWVRFADGREPDALTLPLFCDALPPPILNVMPFKWVPTLELTVHVRGNPAPGWLRVKYETRFAFDGLLETDAEIWDSSDKLVAQSRQLMLAAP